MQTAADSSGFELFECELDWTYDVHLETGPVEVQLQKQVKATDAPDIDYLVGALRFDGKISDSRATWHHNYTSIDRWVRARILRELDERPRNANRLADDLDLAYNTVRHHLDVLEKNDIVTSSDEDYGTVYLPSDRARRRWDTIEDILDQLDS